MHTCRASKRERRPVHGGEGDDVDGNDLVVGYVGDGVDDRGDGVDGDAVVICASKRDLRPAHHGDGDGDDVVDLVDVDGDAKVICIRA